MRISAKRVSELLAGGGELALLDVREQGVHYRGHPFFACAAPLSRLELVIGDLVPRKGAPVVLLDGGGEGLAEQAFKRMTELGYSDVSILEGGCEGWRAAGLSSSAASTYRPRRSASSSSTTTRSEERR